MMKKTIKATLAGALTTTILLFGSANGILHAYQTGDVTAQTEDKTATSLILIQNVNIFDGIHEKLSLNQDILIKGNKIETIGKSIPAPKGATIIDGGGKTLTPGFIDSHAHLMFQVTGAEFASVDALYMAYVATQTAETYLNNGFTTIRDICGNTFSIKKAIDKGIIVGPRVYPSGPMISQTSGHGDLRTPSQNGIGYGGQQSNVQRFGHMMLADGVPEVLKAAREVLHAGATQLKIAVGGGTGTQSDPLDVTQYTDAEIKAIVDVASDWNTYVSAHVYTPKGIRRAIDNGVKSIEHGNLLDEEVLRYMKEKDVWLSPQVSVYTYYPKGYTEDQKKKHDQAFNGIDNMFKLVKKVGFKNVSFGTDIITAPEKMAEINNEFVFRTKWFTPIEILQQATSQSAKLLALSGPRNPYPGKLGVIEEGAFADILLINGNPLEDISILTKPEENLLLIMKDGKIHKNITQK